MSTAQASDGDERSPIDRRQRIFGSVMLLAPAVISVLNGVVIVAERSGWVHGAAMLALVAGTLVVAWRCSVTADRRLLLALLILLAAQLGVLVLTLPATEPHSPLRLLRVAVVLASLATILSAVLAYTRVVGPVNALLLVFGLASAVFVAEATSELLPGVTDGVTSRPEWSDLMVRNRDLGMSYRPHSVVNTYYPDNPRDYFTPRDFRDQLWQLSVAPDSKAELVFPPDDRATVRVAITQAPRAPGWHIQLSQSHLAISPLVGYTVDFRARADQPRPISAAFVQAHAPWAVLGFYRTEQLTAEWKTFHEFFMAGAADSNGRIQFDLGGNGIPVEVSDAALHVQLDSNAIEPPLGPDRFFVSYEFNALGCRDSDYAALRAPGATRILVLGDGSTMGTNVHQGDTFAKRLEHQDSATRPTGSATPAKHHEVINCAVSGYGTTKSKLFYRMSAARDISRISCSLMMGVNDDALFPGAAERRVLRPRRTTCEAVFDLDPVGAAPA